MIRVVFAFCLLILPFSLHAEERQIKLKGGSASFKVSELSPGEEIVVYGTSKGNSSNPIKIGVYGPSGIKLSASASLQEGSLRTSLKKTKNFFPVKLLSKKQAMGKQSECVTFSQGDVLSEEEPEFDPNSIVSTSDPICELYSADDIAALSEALTQTYGGSWDAGRVCGYLVYVYRGGNEGGDVLPTPAPLIQAAVSSDFISADYVGLFEKNACSSEGDTYIFRVKVKLPQKLPSSGYLRIRISETKHYGGKEATIKPISDGKFAPQPLLLMNYLGFCGQNIKITKWSGGKPISSADAKVFDLIHYRDLILTRTPISSYLVGGEATVQLFDQNSGYGACFTLERKRQRVNGYPGDE
jgi:hypothetical protein